MGLMSFVKENVKHFFWREMNKISNVEYNVEILGNSNKIVVLVITMRINKKNLHPLQSLLRTGSLTRSEMSNLSVRPA